MMCVDPEGRGSPRDTKVSLINAGMMPGLSVVGCCFISWFIEVECRW
jgi:hypothetical protein